MGLILHSTAVVSASRSPDNDSQAKFAAVKDCLSLIGFTNEVSTHPGTCYVGLVLRSTAVVTASRSPVNGSQAKFAAVKDCLSLIEFTDEVSTHPDSSDLLCGSRIKQYLCGHYKLQSC